MRKSLTLFLASIIFLFFAPLVSFALAAPPPPVPTCTKTEMPTDFGCLPTTPIGFVQTTYGWGLGLIGFVAVISLMIGGYYLMSSRGNVEYVARGKSYIFYAIAGLLLAILGFVFIEILAGEILQIPGFGT